MKTLTTLTFTALAACGGAQNKPIDSKTLTICAQTQAAICSSEGLQFPYEEGKDSKHRLSDNESGRNYNRIKFLPHTRRINQKPSLQRGE